MIEVIRKTDDLIQVTVKEEGDVMIEIFPDEKGELQFEAYQVRGARKPKDDEPAPPAQGEPPAEPVKRKGLFSKKLTKKGA